MTSSSNLPTIPEWFQGSRVLITGGSGFMGKVLVEKLLRSCPGIDTVYLLLRPKKGNPPSSRIKSITDQPLFDKLRKESPACFSKLIAVAGDVTQLRLGLSDADRDMLQQQVNVVFHSAASVRFDDSIKYAILMNVRGTREVVNLALGIKNLKVLLHVSTSYCNRDEPAVLEELYPAEANWRTIIQLVETQEDNLLNVLTPKILAGAENTYTYAKSLGEHVINDHQHLIPAVIVRPSIVIGTLAEPMPGWIDNFNGPIGLMVGGSVGILRTVYADPDNIGDYVPVDVAIKAIIFIAWHRALSSSSPTLAVYNCTTMTKPHSLEGVIDLGFEFYPECPFNKTIWNPELKPVEFNKFYNYLKVIFYHMLPAMMIDGLLKITGRKPFLSKLQRRIYNTNKALACFTTRNYFFSNTNFVNLQTKHMHPADLEAFEYNRVTTDLVLYMKSCVIGARVYLLKDPLSTVEQAKVHYRRMYWVHQVSRTLVMAAFLWYIDPYTLLCKAAATTQVLLSDFILV